MGIKCCDLQLQANLNRETNQLTLTYHPTCMSQTLTVSSADAVTRHPGTWLLSARPRNAMRKNINCSNE